MKIRMLNSCDFNHGTLWKNLFVFVVSADSVTARDVHALAAHLEIPGKYVVAGQEVDFIKLVGGVCCINSMWVLLELQHV